MARPLLTDELWERIKPLLPPEAPKPKGGRPRVPDRAALTGILFVLRTGIQWELLPQEMGCGCGMTCWRRLRDWQAAGLWRGSVKSCVNWLGASIVFIPSRRLGLVLLGRLPRRRRQLDPATQVS